MPFLYHIELISSLLLFAAMVEQVFITHMVLASAETAVSKRRYYAAEFQSSLSPAMLYRLVCHCDYSIDIGSSDDADKATLCISFY